MAQQYGRILINVQCQQTASTGLPTLPLPLYPTIDGCITNW